MFNHQILPFIQIIFLAEPCCATENIQLFGKSMQGWDGLVSVVAVYDQITVNKEEKYEFETLLLGKLETK